MDENLEILEEFIAESQDGLGEVESILIELERLDELDMTEVNRVFRVFHSIKGTASFLALDNIVSVTHKAESLLDLVRTSSIELTPRRVEALCRSVDFTTQALSQLLDSGGDGPFAEQAVALVELLDGAIQGDDARASKPGASSSSASVESGSRPSSEGTASDVASAPPPAPAVEVDVFGEPIEPADESAADASGRGLAPPSVPVFDDENDYGVQVSDEMMQEFTQDSLDLIERAENALMDYERAGDPEAMRAVFRVVHTIKGNCGFLGLADLEQLVHALENTLETLAEREAPPDQPAAVADRVLAILDTVRRTVATIADTQGKIPDLDEHIAAARAAAGEPETLPAETSPAEASRNAAEDRPTPATGTPPASAGVAANDSGSTTETPTPTRASKPATAKSSDDKGARKHMSIRVDLDKLDELMNLVGELIIAENMVVQDEQLQQMELETFHRATTHLNRITRTLQSLAMSLRMVPLRGTFRKMMRVVRDLERKQGKKIELQIVGDATEVDKTVIEGITDPLVHLIRNAVDHGIESVEERTAAGKATEGSIRLEARHEGGEVWVLVQDDGKGLDREKILQKARERDIVRGSGDDMSDQEVFELIFEPGFSTAAALTDVSGRGVGMDVVRRQIESLRGRIDITSRVGEGTTFALRIPLTLAIVEGMLVRVGARNYTIPLFSIRESVSPDPEDIRVLSDGTEVLCLRGQFIPIVRLATLHAAESDCDELHQGILVIVEEAGRSLALFVDALLGQRQTVIKALPRYFGALPGLAGCSILGNGDISLIVDVKTLSERIRQAA